MRIVRGDFGDPRVVALLDTHVTTASAATAHGSAHALDLSALQSPDIAFWTIWDDDVLLGCGALKRLSAEHGELKSMHTAQAARRRGAGGTMLAHLIAEARGAGLSRLSLETGSWDFFMPARALYARYGFIECGPFESYVPDSNSVFMTLELVAQA
jgi:putative acetyltransferase